MTAEPTTPAPVCCGQTSGAWVPGAGQPVALGCQLCPHPENSTYWRKQKAATRKE